MYLTSESWKPEGPEPIQRSWFISYWWQPTRRESAWPSLSQGINQIGPQTTDHWALTDQSLFASRGEANEMEEVTATEISAIHRGSSFFVDANCHLYRPHRKKSETVRYVYCYFCRVTGRGIFKDNMKCRAFGSIDLEKNTIKLTTKHNHEPRDAFIAQLRARNRILKRVTEEPGKSLKQIFEEENGLQHGLIYRSLFWTMRRLRPWV